MPEDDLAVAGEVLVEGDTVVGTAEEGRQRVLSILKPRPAKVFAVCATRKLQRSGFVSFAGAKNSEGSW